MTIYIDFSVGHEYTTESANNYLMYGYLPGGFLGAVLRNDLFKAASCADHQNRPVLSEIALAVYNNFPARSFGSEELIKAWVTDVDGRRTAWATAIEKAYTWRVLKGEAVDKVKKEQRPF
jgi:hypothetical protein